MKLKLFVAVMFGVMAVPVSAQHDQYHLQDWNSPQATSSRSALPNVPSERPRAFRQVTEAVAKDFGVCVGHLMTQYEYVGWGHWTDGSYIIIFQNDRNMHVSTNHGFGLWGNDGPGVSFQNIRGDGRFVRVLPKRSLEGGFGLSLGKKKRRNFMFDIFPTGRMCPTGMRCHADCR